MSEWRDCYSYVIMTMPEEVTKVESVQRSTEFMGNGAWFDAPMRL